MTGQVYIGKVVDVSKMDADNLELLEVVCGKGGRWSGVAQNGQFYLGDTCQVYLQDSLLPQTPEYEFMARHGYRVKMMRLRGVPSEVLIMPQNIPGEVGDDVTELAGVTKYEKPIPAHLAGVVRGTFPLFIHKTDEPNFQTVPELVDALRFEDWVATVKCDGSSGTAYRHNGEFGVCSRNLELRESDDNVFWQVARRAGLEDNLPRGYAVQFEVVGPNIQGNPMGLQRPELRVFNLFDIEEQEYLGHDPTVQWCREWGIPTVPLAGSGSGLNATAEELRRMAEGTYENGRQREGIVIRSRREMHVKGKRVSFKVLNLRYSS